MHQAAAAAQGSDGSGNGDSDSGSASGSTGGSEEDGAAVDDSADSDFQPQEDEAEAGGGGSGAVGGSKRQRQNHPTPHSAGKASSTGASVGVCTAVRLCSTGTRNSGAGHVEVFRMPTVAQLPSTYTIIIVHVNLTHTSSVCYAVLRAWSALLLRCI